MKKIPGDPWTARRCVTVLGVCLLVALAASSSRSSECESRVPARFVLEDTLAGRWNGERGDEIVMGETSNRHFTVLQLWNDHGLPVCWREVTFESHAPEQVDFLEERAATNENGVVANVLVRKLGARNVDTQFTVRTKDGVADTFPIRGTSWYTDGSPFSFNAPPLEEFFGPTQVIRGWVHNFVSDLENGYQVRVWAIDPRIAEPASMVATDEFHWPSGAQRAICSVTARAQGETVFLVNTVECSTYTAEIRGDIHPLFIRGDCNLDDSIDLSDAVFALDGLFRGGAQFRLLEACNPNDDASVDIADAIYLLNHLFRGGAAPPPPFPDRGRDPDPP